MRELFKKSIYKTFIKSGGVMIILWGTEIERIKKIQKKNNNSFKHFSLKFNSIVSAKIVSNNYEI